MANLTRAQIADRALERVGAKPSGQAGSAEDTKLAKETVDSIFEQLEAEELAPFETTAVPPWAQAPLIKLVAGELMPYFGFTEQEANVLKSVGRQDLSRQVTSKTEHLQPTTRFY